MNIHEKARKPEKVQDEFLLLQNQCQSHTHKIIKVY